MLDVGCGQGELTTALAVAGYDVLGIDPLAPAGELFRRLKLEDVDEAERFDGIVAAFSLHHVRDLDAGLDKIAGLLRPGGRLVVDEFAWDRLDETDARLVLRPAARARGRRARRRARLAGRAASAVGRRSISACTGSPPCARASTRASTSGSSRGLPHLHRTLAGVATEVLEQALIDAGAIQALGFRYAGVVRPG